MSRPRWTMEDTGNRCAQTRLTRKRECLSMDLFGDGCLGGLRSLKSSSITFWLQLCRISRWFWISGQTWAGLPAR